MRILYIQASLVPPPANTALDRFLLLSEHLEGDVLQPVWAESPEQIENMFGPGTYPVYRVGNFRYHWFLAWRYKGLRRTLEIFRFYVRKGLQVYRETGFDCIVVYSHMTTAMLAIVLKLLTGAKLIVEIVTSPSRIFLTFRAKPTLRDRAMHLYSDICLHLSMWASDRAHFLCPGALSEYRLLKNVPNSVFHDFVPISIVERHVDTAEDSSRQRYVALVGAPWYLKGADVLIEAFLRLAADFPDVKLKLLGHYPEFAGLAKLPGMEQVEVLKAKPHLEAMRFISEATVFVLPSRCEGLPRVLMEAMAAGVPIIGSNVSGIPYIIRDGENGFVVPVGDAVQLEARLRQLLSDSDLCRRMGERGYERAHSQLDEKTYVREFTRMVEAALRPEAKPGNSTKAG